MGEETQRIPKPMIPVGNRPILWHIMKWYASWGHTDFVLCLGYKGESIKEYFLDYNEALSNDFVLSNGGRTSSCSAPTSPTGGSRSSTPAHQATIGERLMAVEPHLGDDEYFLATYGDGLTDAPLDDMIERSSVAARPGSSSRCARSSTRTSSTPTTTASSARSRTSSRRTSGSTAASSCSAARSSSTTSSPGEELVEEPFRRLIEKGELIAYRYEGFWEPMDTIKDKQRLDALAESGRAPWRHVGREPAPGAPC